MKKYKKVDKRNINYNCTAVIRNCTNNYNQKQYLLLYNKFICIRHLYNIPRNQKHSYNFSKYILHVMDLIN